MADLLTYGPVVSEIRGNIRNKHYNRYTPEDFSQLRQLYMFLTLTESIGKFWPSCQITSEAWPKHL